MKRLPFRFKPTAAILQKTMKNLLQSMPFVVVYEDITVSDKNMTDNIRNLKLNKLMLAGLKLKEINYLSFTIDRYGQEK